MQYFQIKNLFLFQFQNVDDVVFRAASHEVMVNQIDPEAGPNHPIRGQHKGVEHSYNKCFGISPEFHGKDHPCKFPFIYRGIVSNIFLELEA